MKKILRYKFFIALVLFLEACNIRKGNPLVLFNIFAATSFGVVVILWLMLWLRRRKE